VLYLSAEDDREEIHIRLDGICAAEGLDMKSLPIACLHCAGRDVVLAVEDKGRVKPTDNFGLLAKACATVKPRLVVIDPQANVFAVNENSRPSAIACISLLRGLAIDHDCAVLLISHPSLSGMNSGTGTAGSTSWNNAVRSRLYFTSRRPGAAEDEDDEVDPDMRYLSPKKSNYSKLGDTIALRWQDGRFVLADAERPFDGITTAHLERVRVAFRDGDWRYDERATDWGGYCAADIIGLDLGRGLSMRDLTKAQQKARRKIRTVLSTWVRSNQIGIVERDDAATRKRFRFFCVRGV
jgi:RecA-family ATPase